MYIPISKGVDYMYSWVGQEQWFILSIVGLYVFLKKFRYNESIFSEYNKLITLFIPANIIMLIGSSMQMLNCEKKYILLHDKITMVYGIVILAFLLYWGYQMGSLSKIAKICLMISGLGIITFFLIEYFL